MSGLKRVAVVTASYADDFERCRLLCDSMDALVENATDHFILVDKDDFQLFSQLDGARRHVVNELDILPRWLHSMRQGFSFAIGTQSMVFDENLAAPGLACSAIATHSACRAHRP